VLEVNLRFDTETNQLARGFKVLRLRYDKKTRLTFKGPASDQDGVRLRKEIEFEVSDFSAARSFLEALGYSVAMIYEKYRQAFVLKEVEISLDELPYGTFVELEGPDSKSIREVNSLLDLDWGKRIDESYASLFDRLRREAGFSFRDLVFENFEGKQIDLEVLGIHPADG
jgi:adenylate cyclase class 2